MYSLILAAVAATLPIQSPPNPRPNIVVFVGDDLGWRDTGPYGNAEVRTPNIDRLARTGLLVRYAFGTSPQCSPSRISILSGRYSHATRTEDLHTPLPPGERLLPSYLQAEGYFTGHMAKTHYGPLAEKQFQWYSATTADSLPTFLDAAGDRPFFLSRPTWPTPRRPGPTSPGTTTRSPGWTAPSGRWSESWSGEGCGTARSSSSSVTTAHRSPGRREPSTTRGPGRR